MLIQIEDGLAINPANIESVEKKGKVTVQVIMQSGNKHLAQIPYKAMIEISNKDSSLAEILKNIDSNTLRFSA